MQCPVGEGTVSVETMRDLKLGAALTLPPNPAPLGGLPEMVSPDGMIAAINIPRMLDRLLREVSRAKRKQARPRDIGKRDIVACALDFFQDNSTAQVTTYPGGQFATFCRRFHEVIAGEYLDLDGLQYQIRKEVRSNQ